MKEFSDFMQSGQLKGKQGTVHLVAQREGKGMEVDRSSGGLHSCILLLSGLGYIFCHINSGFYLLTSTHKTFSPPPTPLSLVVLPSQDI